MLKVQQISERPDFYTSKKNDIGGVRIRRQPALRPNRSEAGRFEKAMESKEGHELMKASKTKILYNRALNQDKTKSRMRD